MAEVRTAERNKCVKCGAPKPVVSGLPPEECWADCRKCKHRWKVCGARHAHGPCMKPPTKKVPGARRCFHDGGASTGRPVTTGRRSKYMPTHLAELSEEAHQDPELISSRENIANLEALINSKWKELQTLGIDPTEEWCKVRSAAAEAKAALKKGDTKRLASAVDAMMTSVDRGSQYDSHVETILDLMERFRRHSETEVRRLAALNQYVEARRLVVFFARLRQDILECVTNRAERAELARRLAGYVDTPAIG